MKIARFHYQERELYGAVEEQQVKIIEGDIYGSYRVTEEVLPLADVRLLAPVKPSKVIGVGLNYQSVAKDKGVEFPAEPILFLKPPSGIIGPGDSVIIPELVKKPVFEVELAVIIGKTAKNVTEETALDYCLGYTLANDITAKDHMIKGQPWAKGKSFDTFTPVGPYIVTGIDPENTEITLLLNGEQKQHSSTQDMIFGVRKVIAFISQVMTLEAGDLIITGTPLGGGDFAAGDVFTLASPAIGTITNPVR
ncbi:fumarylacetoacetate hydrolase family protein [Anaerospora hongkongensis]|uniref:fumarylacetoacetate hydrolase family protein n=1 Tax=Anaerospora hongkongensis TaxID=244830 RepID=UPI00289B91F0|nr:fumarylacetoacetate hydrolase family protein [Anaerospora hongkongensis]